MTRDEVWVRFVERGIEWAGRVTAAAVAAGKSADGALDSFVNDADKLLRAYDERFPAKQPEESPGGLETANELRRRIRCLLKEWFAGHNREQECGGTALSIRGKCLLAKASLACNVGAITVNEYLQCDAWSRGVCAAEPWWTQSD